MNSRLTCQIHIRFSHPLCRARSPRATLLTQPPPSPLLRSHLHCPSQASPASPGPASSFHNDTAPLRSFSISGLLHLAAHGPSKRLGFSVMSRSPGYFCSSPSVGIRSNPQRLLHTGCLSPPYPICQQITRALLSTVSNRLSAFLPSPPPSSSPEFRFLPPVSMLLPVPIGSLFSCIHWQAGCRSHYPTLI